MNYTLNLQREAFLNEGSPNGYILDMHTHSLASGHSYSTIREMAHMASKKGMQALGITEHGPQMPGSCHNFYFSNLKVVPRQM